MKSKIIAQFNFPAPGSATLPRGRQRSRGNFFSSLKRRLSGTRAGTAVRSVSEYRARPASLAPSMTDTASVCRYENPANNLSYQLQLIILHTQLTKM